MAMLNNQRVYLLVNRFILESTEISSPIAQSFESVWTPFGHLDVNHLAQHAPTEASNSHQFALPGPYLGHAIETWIHSQWMGIGVLSGEKEVDKSRNDEIKTKWFVDHLLLPKSS